MMQTGGRRLQERVPGGGGCLTRLRGKGKEAKGGVSR